ncbi:MAG: hypothetical protein H0T80_09085 [Betaproteobacteria bacterium]|nr:hypothetical protein [Betaproteobacteria bacterium]
MIAVADALLYLDRERVADALIEHVRTDILLAEVQARYDAVEDTDEIVRLCAEIVKDECEFLQEMRDTRVIESSTHPTNTPAGA